ncbi:MAG TPA: elongation factor G [Acidobacteriota bacterium]|nr:elongation factor G [Acidobacteriota bacterium]
MSADQNVLPKSIAKVRNVGIIAHIDAGKTTVTERFLFYAGLTHKIGEVHDGDTVMDFRDDERERGITISAAATTFIWNGLQINLIDTPGHIDFTAEVERSLRVLDGAVVVFSGVEGVQPQSETVWHQADRYGVPRLAFINKLDRAGADPGRVLAEIEGRLGAKAAFINLSHGEEQSLDGVIDLLEMKWLVFDPASRGRELDAREIPADCAAAAQAARDRLIQRTAESVDWLADLYLGEKPITIEQLKRAIREATLAAKMVPVLCGAALRDLGIRPILDAVCDFLPSPKDRPPARRQVPATGAPAERAQDRSHPFSALVFKVVAAPSADLFWLRIYSGSVGGDDRCLHPRSGASIRLRRFLRIYADRTQPVARAECGDIVAVAGLKNVATGDTLCDPAHPITYEPMHFPQPVVSVAVEAQTSEDRDRLLDVVARLAREDPTFTYHTDEESGQLILSGMGELHLEILQNRMRRQFNVAALFGRPRVNYRTTVSGQAAGSGEFDKKIGDVHVTGRAVVEIAPRPRPAGELGLPPVEALLAGRARSLTAALQRETQETIEVVCMSGDADGYPVVDVKVRVLEVRMSDFPDPTVPLRASLTMALRNAFTLAGLKLLEPVMRLEARVPEVFLGAVVRDLGARRAEIRETAFLGTVATIHAFVPLAAMFGYSTDLRSLTQGHGSFSMEPFDYQPVSGTA